MQRSFHDSLHLSVQIWIASCDLARKGAFDYAAKCQFRIPRMRCFKTLQRDKFRKLTKGKHMMLALYLTLIEYFHIFVICLPKNQRAISSREALKFTDVTCSLNDLPGAVYRET